jgi:hypothetical protein
MRRNGEGRRGKEHTAKCWRVQISFSLLIYVLFDDPYMQSISGNRVVAGTIEYLAADDSIVSFGCTVVRHHLVSGTTSTTQAFYCYDASGFGYLLMARAFTDYTSTYVNGGTFATVASGASFGGGGGTIKNGLENYRVGVSKSAR